MDIIGEFGIVRILSTVLPFKSLCAQRTRRGVHSILVRIQFATRDPEHEMI